MTPKSFAIAAVMVVCLKSACYSNHQYKAVSPDILVLTLEDEKLFGVLSEGRLSSRSVRDPSKHTEFSVRGLLVKDHLGNPAPWDVRDGAIGYVWSHWDGRTNYDVAIIHRDLDSFPDPDTSHVPPEFTPRGAITSGIGGVGYYLSLAARGDSRPVCFDVVVNPDRHFTAVTQAGGRIQVIDYDLSHDDPRQRQTRIRLDLTRVVSCPFHAIRTDDAVIVVDADFEVYRIAESDLLPLGRLKPVGNEPKMILVRDHDRDILMALQHAGNDLVPIEFVPIRADIQSPFATVLPTPERTAMLKMLEQPSK